MLSRPHIRFISLLAILFALAQANVLNPRQGGLLNDISSILDPAGPSSSESSTSEPSSTTPVPSTSRESSVPPATSEPPTTTPPSSSSSTTPPPTSSPPSSTTPDPTPTSSSQDESTPTPPKTTPSPSVVFVTTVVDGSTSSYQTTMTSASTSGKPTNGASLDSSSKSSSSGMSPQTKRTVIGVVVGVGGAIVLAALFIVAWRIWGRKKNEDEGDGLMGYRAGSSGQEKDGSISTAPSSNPFQTTLDQYHAPNRPVNASSNF